jgi:beta-galactosidase/beta-glucuronidase
MHFPINKLILLKYFTKNILRRFFIVFFMLCSWWAELSAQAQQTNAMPLTRQHISFDQDWKFHLGHATDPAQDFNFSTTDVFSKSGKTGESAIAVKFNDSSWRSLQLPHDWAVELPFENSTSFEVMSHGYKPVGALYPQNSIGWYRKHFKIARSDSGQRFVIQFDGIYRDSKIWVNGFYLGTNASGYAVFPMISATISISIRTMCWWCGWMHLNMRDGTMKVQAFTAMYG